MRGSLIDDLYKYEGLGYLTPEGLEFAEQILKIFDLYHLSYDRIRISYDDFYYGWSVQITINLPNIALIIEISPTIDVSIYNFNSPSFQYPANLQNLTFNQTDVVYEYLTSVLDDPNSYVIDWLDD